MTECVIESFKDDPTPEKGWARWAFGLKCVAPAEVAGVQWTHRFLLGTTDDPKCERVDTFEKKQGGRNDSNEYDKRSGWWPFAVNSGTDPSITPSPTVNKQLIGKHVLCKSYTKPSGRDDYPLDVKVGDWWKVGVRAPAVIPLPGAGGTAPGTERLADGAVLPPVDEAPSAAPVGARDIGSR